MGHGDFAPHAPFCLPQQAGGRLKQFCPVPFWAGPGHTSSQVVLTTTSEGRYCDHPLEIRNTRLRIGGGGTQSWVYFPASPP